MPDDVFDDSKAHDMTIDFSPDSCLFCDQKRVPYFDKIANKERLFCLNRDCEENDLYQVDVKELIQLHNQVAKYSRD